MEVEGEWWQLTRVKWRSERRSDRGRSEVVSRTRKPTQDQTSCVGTQCNFSDREINRVKAQERCLLVKRSFCSVSKSGAHSGSSSATPARFFLAFPPFTRLASSHAPSSPLGDLPSCAEQARLQHSHGPPFHPLLMPRSSLASQTPIAILLTMTRCKRQSRVSRSSRREDW